MFRHILCPTDLKERSAKAVTRAVQIAHAFGAKITLLNVHAEFMDRKERAMLRVSTDRIQENFRVIAVKAREEMRAMVRDCHAEQLEVAYLLREGKPERVIPETAAEIGADLIVMCTDGRDNIGDFMVGTITERVINRSGCPVLVIPLA